MTNIQSPNLDTTTKIFIAHKNTLPRFLIVGVTNTIISYAVFWFAVKTLPPFSLRATTSQLLSYSAGILWSFFWNRRWTFKSEGSFGAEMWRFVALQISLLLTSACLIGLMVDFMSFPATGSWILVMSCITMVNYILSKKWVFNRD
jgi:putative flippase GtrA